MRTDRLTRADRDARRSRLTHDWHGYDDEVICRRCAVAAWMTAATLPCDVPEARHA